MSDSETTAWVTVAEAAESARVDSGTIRQWYRAGRVPTRRSEGERGAFLVPLDLVLALAHPADPTATPPASTLSIEEALRGQSAEHSSAETASLKKQLAEAGERLEFLRSQLAEAAEENRALKQQLQLADDQRADLRAELADAVDDRKGVEARLLTVESEVAQLRRAAARGSITDNSWLDLQTPAYESPVRRQVLAAPPPARPPAPAGGPTAPFADPAARSSELAGLLADTRPDGADDPGAGSPPPDGIDGFHDAEEEYTAARAIRTDEAPHPPLGESPDDLLPESDRRGRFGKK